MTIESTMSRRSFLQLGASLGVLAGLGRVRLAQAAVSDYKALVCLFMFGGNDGHNMIVPMGNPQYAAYTNARGALALGANQLLPISDSLQGSFGFHPAMPEIQALYNSGALGVVANVGMLVQATSYNQWTTPNYPLPLNLRSHSDQVTQMQTAVPSASGSYGWGGHAIDIMEFKYGYNSTSNFPPSISIGGPALFCTGANVAGVSLQPGNYLDQTGLGGFPAGAAQAKDIAQGTIVSATNPSSIINASNKVLADARALSPSLHAAASSITFNQAFPQNSLGDQLQEIARVISVSSQLGLGRQVFFCSLGGFDTHSGQPYQQGYLLGQVSQALNAFYAATNQLGVADQVTTFTLSDFGRTLQPSGSGSDHGWGNHHLIMGGAVQGGRIFGKFPLMTNYANFNATNDDYADNRGVMLPNIALAEYGATLARWFGADDTDLSDIFQKTPTFANANLGFLA